jgi:hypothetical protein
MKIDGYIGNERVAFNVDGLPVPVVNVTTNVARSNRVEALYAALVYHRDHQDDDTVPDAEEICNTALAFEYYLQHGEYPAG